jgi:hypothetical protein
MRRLGKDSTVPQSKRPEVMKEENNDQGDSSSSSSSSFRLSWCRAAFLGALLLLALRGFFFL